MKIRKGDNVKVIAGKDKGKTGTVLRAFPREDTVLVEGVNIVKKHARNRRRRSQGQIVERPAPVHVSNVSLMEEGKPVRAGYSREGAARKTRISRASGKEI